MLFGTYHSSVHPARGTHGRFSEVTKFAEVLEPFCNGPKTEVALINIVQMYCYEESKVMKTFPQMLKVRLFFCDGVVV